MSFIQSSATWCTVWNLELQLVVAGELGGGLLQRQELFGADVLLVIRQILHIEITWFFADLLALSLEG
jgi:hypothetical protein